MNTVMLEVINCPMSGELGLIVKGMPVDENTGADLEGRLIAHDLIEHVNGHRNIGSVGDELEALGAVWFTRGHLSDITRGKYAGYYTPESSLSTDIAEMYRYYRYMGFGMPVPYMSAEENLEEPMRAMMREAIEHIKAESDNFRQERDDVGRFLFAVRHFMRSGYCKQATRHDGNEYQANNMFWSIAAAVEDVAKHVEYEGQEFALEYDENGARCSEYYEEDEERGCDECGEWFIPEDDEDSTENSNGYLMCGECARAEEEARA